MIKRDMQITEYIESRLFELQDLEYKEFHSRLMPNIETERIIGVRTPNLRKLSKELAKEPDIELFLGQLPHHYYEENNVHGFVIETFKDYDKVIEHLDRFLPYVDNWATCDMMTPKIFKKHLTQLLEKINEWIESDNTYMIRFGIRMLMNFYLEDNFEQKYLEKVAAIKSEEYYVNMMIAWYFATALAKQYSTTVKVIENHRLDKWIHNKTIQKAVESNRIAKQQKEYLKTLKEK